MQQLIIETGIPIPDRTSKEYKIGTKIFNSLNVGDSVFVHSVDPVKISIRLKRLSAGGSSLFKVHKDIGVVSDYPCSCNACKFLLDKSEGDGGKCKKIMGEGYRVYRIS